jgi:hypothetical protein
MHLNFRNLAAALAGYGGAVYCKGIARPSLPLRQQPSGMSQRQRYGGSIGIFPLDLPEMLQDADESS